MRWVLRAVVVLLPACFRPNYDHPACGPGGACPSGFTCNVASGFCEPPGDGSGGDDAGIDAPRMTTDANVVDAVIRLDASLCGDGQVETAAGEACDDGNTSACGTCSADCLTITSSMATGKIITADAVGTNIMDGDTFTLVDGSKLNTFEFGSIVSAGHIPIRFSAGDTAAKVADAIIMAIITKSTTAITISGGSGATIILTNGRATSLGNQQIGRTGGIATSFTFIGMSGGQGGDCDPGVGCKTGDDCTTGACNSMGRCN